MKESFKIIISQNNKRFTSYYDIPNIEFARVERSSSENELKSSRSFNLRLKRSSEARSRIEYSRRIWPTRNSPDLDEVLDSRESWNYMQKDEEEDCLRGRMGEKEKKLQVAAGEKKREREGGGGGGGGGKWPKLKFKRFFSACSKRFSRRSSAV